LRALLNEGVDHRLLKHAAWPFLAPTYIDERQFTIFHQTIQRIAGHVQALCCLSRIQQRSFHRQTIHRTRGESGPGKSPARMKAGSRSSHAPRGKLFISELALAELSRLFTNFIVRELPEQIQSTRSRYKSGHL
jgi:hypothetical protein